MEQVKIGGTAITYWQNKGALMLQGLQGPTENTQRMNERLVELLWGGIGGLPPTQTSTALDTRNTITEWEAEVIKEFRKTKDAATKQDTATSGQTQEIARVDIQGLISYIEDWTPDAKKREETENGQHDNATSSSAASSETPQQGK